jgi:hypothetical protein
MESGILITLVLPIIAVGIGLIVVARMARRRAARLASQGETASRIAVLGPSAGFGRYFHVLFVGPQPKFVALFGKLLAVLVVLFVLAVLAVVGVAIVGAI